MEGERTEPAAETRAFFDCLDTKISSEAGGWLAGLKKNMKTLGLAKLARDAQELDKSAKAIGCQHMQHISQALARMATPAAAMRKMGLKTLYYTCGRSGETRCISLEGLDWDWDAECLAADVSEFKVGKAKLIAIVAGANRHLDWFLDYADYLVLQQSKPVFTDDERAWLMHELHQTECSAEVHPPPHSPHTLARASPPPPVK